MIKDIGELLALDDRGVGYAQNTCARLLRLIFFELNITNNKWDARVREYLTNKKSGIPDNATARSSKRSNLNRAVVSDTTTWDTFRDALWVLGSKDIYYHFKFEWDKNIILPKEPVLELTYRRQSQESELTYVFRNIFHSIGGNPHIWEHFVNRYLNKVTKGKAYNPIDRSTERGNLHKAIIKNDSYTWENFTKALEVIGVIKTTIVVELVWSKTKSTRHESTFSTGA